jgi:hypothetical protein
LADLNRMLGLQKFLEQRRAAGPSYDLDAPFFSESSSAAPCRKKARKMPRTSSSEEEAEEDDEYVGAPGIHYTHIRQVIML